MPFLEKIGYMKNWGYLFWSFFKFLTKQMVWPSPTFVQNDFI